MKPLISPPAPLVPVEVRVADLHTLDDVAVHADRRKGRKDRLSPERVRELDDQALCLALLHAFSQVPDLDALEMVDDSKPNASRKEQRKELSVRAYLSDHRYGPEAQAATRPVRKLVQAAFQDYAKRQPDAFARLSFGREVFKRLDREDWAPWLGGDRWWAVQRAVWLDDRLDDAPVPRRALRM